MEFGIFDHVDRSNVPLAQFYEDRLKLVEVFDRQGFYGYHIAEHHFTPLGIAASPGIYLSAIAQRTTRLRFGPIVYILPMYHPLRLAEEICMLDQMSGGRLEVGVGRGVSPIEAAYYGEPTERTASRQVFTESLEILLSALTKKNTTVLGRYRKAENVPMQLDTIQKPHPPLWMGVNTDENAEFAAQHGMSFLCNLPPEPVRQRVVHYRKVAAGLNVPQARPPKFAQNFFIVVGETDEAALRVAKRAYLKWHHSFHYLYHLHGRSPMLGERPTDFEVVMQEGRGIAGTPSTVAKYLAPRIAESGINYMTGQFIFGDLTLAEATRSVELFGQEVMPQLRAL
jgi:alkanesulfonate monooxygenase SsuD/methylene tetrahydromethanopterin reductase-like flavin-dependent oxidoreductase (luciferase family)